VKAYEIIFQIIMFIKPRTMNSFRDMIFERFRNMLIL